MVKVDPDFRYKDFLKVAEPDFLGKVEPHCRYTNFLKLVEPEFGVNSLTNIFGVKSLTISRSTR